MQYIKKFFVFFINHRSLIPLTFYDATGNVVRKININAASGGVPSVHNVPTVPKTIAEWDLRDASGRSVSAGTYLMRGVITAVDGTRERVSLVVGVR